MLEDKISAIQFVYVVGCLISFSLGLLIGHIGRMLFEMRENSKEADEQVALMKKIDANYRPSDKKGRQP